MRITLGDDWTATVMGEPLRVTPHFDFSSPGVHLAPYANRAESERFLLDTFGSQ
ncbi:hypothetical protein [Streptomyces sp. SA15]|uniref:hypothetical protein n=1 Tax=Streptomyces sp. SA15 TaxID=934019 RepID=UPI0015CC86CA|nr:hypothetical protein [Streptomyces sp. SA15]